MNLDLTLDELAMICASMEVTQGDPDLTERLRAVLHFEQELDELSFDDDDGCAGGACKL